MTNIEPPDLAVIARLSPDGLPEDVFVRHDAAAEEGGYGDEHWNRACQDCCEYPKTWRDLSKELRGDFVRLIVVDDGARERLARHLHLQSIKSMDDCLREADTILTVIAGKET